MAPVSSASEGAVREIGRGTSVFTTGAARGPWRLLESPDDVLELLDDGSAAGIVAAVRDAGATFLAPVFEDFTAVVCLSGTPRSHIGIVSREHQIPCVMGTELDEEPSDGTEVEVDCSQEAGVVRVIA